MYESLENSRSPIFWGFTATDEAPSGLGIVREHFKTQLQVEDNDTVNPSASQDPFAAKNTLDYLECLHAQIQSVFNPTVLGKSWNKATVSFLFSAPALWNADTISRFRALAESAGFATPDGSRTIDIRLTETIAACIHTIKVSPGDIKASSHLAALGVDPFSGLID